MPYGVLVKLATRFFMDKPDQSLGHTEKRTRKIDVRFTETEYQQVLDLEKELGLSKADLVRIRVLDQAGVIVINAQQLLLAIDLIGTELARAGNNINQLAHHANSLRLQGRVDDLLIVKLNTQMDQYLKLQDQLERSLRKIIREMGRSS